MTAHTANTTSGNDHDFVESSESDPCDESDLNGKLAEWGLEPIKAYARITSQKKKVSRAAEKKREYRAQRKVEGFDQCVVEVPADEDAKRTVYAVAQAIVGDKDDNMNMRSITLSVFSNPLLLRLAERVSSSQIDVSSIVELIKSGDWTEVAAIQTVHPSLVKDIVRLAKSNGEFLSVIACLVRHGEDISAGSAKGLLEAAAAANDCREVVRMVEVRKRGGLRSRVLGWVLR
ncbi:hypothetical protein [Bradyrhizobium japonicum]|uniref:hypothetical protein n=1 Tax=Bradyrhizobium japonicum TaxID=375 RepID=UPI001BAD8CCA|nr:hypothetical protein [Bradyrhizobium japonicum]MBR0914658.1 hypothetical protein [Bradyrhizobium japonicum]